MRTVGVPRFTRASSWRRAGSGSAPAGGGPQVAPTPSTRSPADPIAGLGLPLGFPAGVDLFQQGAAPESVFFLVDGLVKLVRIQPNGREAIVGLRPGRAVLGMASVLADEPYPVSATSVTRCRLVRIEAGLLRRRLREDPELSLLLHRAQSAELNELHVRVADLCSLTAGERLEQFLGEFLELLGGDASDGPCRIPLTQSEIASAVGVSPPYLCRLLHRFAADGSVRWERNRLVLTRRLR